MILLLAQGIGWPLSYACCAGGMILAIVATLFAPEPARADAVMQKKTGRGLSPKVAYNAVVGPFVSFFTAFAPPPC